MIPDHEIMEKRLAEQKMQLNKDYMVQTIDILERMKQRFGPDVYQVVEQVVAERTIQKWMKSLNVRKAAPLMI